MASLSPDPVLQFFDANGDPLAGGTLRTFAAGTTTPLATYTDASGGTPNPVQIILNARGEAAVWLGPVLYYMELHDAAGALIWTADNIGGSITQANIDQILIDYAAPGGSDLIGFIQAGSGAVPRTLQEKGREEVSISDFGAVINGTTDDLAAVNTTILNSSSVAIHVPRGNSRISAVPTNPMGRTLLGEGKLLQDITIGGQPSTYQVNSYTPDLKLFMGSEYLYRAYARVQNFVYTSSLSNLSIRLFGDSTVQGIPSHTAPYFLVNLIPAMLRAKGITNLSVVNHGVSGSSVIDMNPALIDVNTDLIFIKYGINDFNSGLVNFATNLRSKLATIRATSTVNQLSIVLVSPSATYQAFGLTTSWYEDLRRIYVQAARDYQCAYFDTYAMLQDVRQAAGFWMDNPGGGATVHPENMGQSWIWGAVLDAVFPGSSLINVRTNNFTNDGGVAYPLAAPTDIPTSYPIGYSLRRATVANGWPLEGIVETVRQIDQIVTQRLTKALTNDFPIVYTRTNVNATDTWGGWAGLEVNPALQNGWVNFSVNHSTAGAVVSAEKRVMLKGIIASGTVTAGTLLFTLPAGMRPAKIAICPVFLANSLMSAVTVAVNGQVTAQAALNATFTSLDGASFLAI